MTEISIPKWASREYTRGQRMRALADKRGLTYAALIDAWYWGDAELEQALGSTDSLPMPSKESEAMCMLGFSGHPIEWVAGWRYGSIPAEGCSFNYREQHWERGISLMAIDGDDAQTMEMALTEAFNSDRPIIKIRGLRTPWCGSDGEPLVLLASEIKEA